LNSNTYNTPFTTQALIALEEAILQGINTVKYSDKEITYRSLDDMLRIRDMLRNKLGMDPASSTSTEGKGFFGGRKKIGRNTKGLD
jgi:hypothetical protein